MFYIHGGRKFLVDSPRQCVYYRKFFKEVFLKRNFFDQELGPPQIYEPRPSHTPGMNSPRERTGTTNLNYFCIPRNFCRVTTQDIRVCVVATAHKHCTVSPFIQKKKTEKHTPGVC